MFGGIPAPNPDYPQDIRVVTGENSLIVKNKNFIDYSKFIPYSSAMSYTYTDENVVVNYVSVFTGVSQNIPITNKKYTISIEDIEKVNGKGQLEIRRYKNGVVVGDALVGTTMPYSVVIDNTNGDYDSVRITLGNSNLSGTNTITFKKIQVEVGDTKTTYEKGVTQTYTLHLGTEYLAGIGTYKDEIIGKTDEWKIKRYVEKVVLSNIEETEVNNLYRNLDIKSPIQQAFSKHFINVVDSRIDSNYWANEILDNNEFSFRVHETNNYLYLKSTLSAQEIIALNDEIFLVLATPVEIPITDQTLITDLNNMYQAMGYDGKTNITVTSEDTNAQMEVEVTYTSESDMCEKLLFIFNKMKDKLYHIIRSL